MTQILKEKLSKIESEFKNLQASYNVQKIGFFGSIVRDDFTNDSDIDVIVEFSKPIGLFKFFELQRLLSELLGFEVDLVTKNAIKPAIKKSVINEAIYV